MLRFPRGLDFRMEMSGSPVPCSSDDALAGHDYCANSRVWMCAAQAFARFKNRLAHESFINCHCHTTLDILRTAFNGKLELTSLKGEKSCPWPSWQEQLFMSFLKVRIAASQIR